ncbi:hypothetical protein L210DRAFT_3520269 [Boletus edulis BED1]|uniref:Transcription initiation factor TFIID subunit 8 n=1 Tax=Boletus edulis BED1 TaxID=1328754 RepID=A0AAD4C625_BOLED|nr:hypothetical protein L210DRAFT_3520269 [Boletus edulis BED1]
MNPLGYRGRRCLVCCYGMSQLQEPGEVTMHQMKLVGPWRLMCLVCLGGMNESELCRTRSSITTAMFTGYPPYGTYQAPYPAYPIPPPGQPMAAAAALPHFTHFPQPPPGYPLYALQPARAPSPPPGPPTAPDIPTISPQIASNQVRKLIVTQLKMAEFEAIEPRALQRLELEVVAFIQALYEQAHEYANLASRAIPVAADVLLACNDRGLKAKDLHGIALASRSICASAETSLELPPSREASPELLSSDDEGTPPIIPTTLRSLPSYFPSLPPKHTYLKTPASPPKKAALPSLERKLKTAGLVQESLKNLLTATEDNLGQEDVNCEASMYPRKRWKVMQQ